MDLNQQEDPAYGGPRFCTFMIYLSHVEAGGRTVFPLSGRLRLKLHKD